MCCCCKKECEGTLDVTENEKAINICGDGFEIRFDKVDGTVASYKAFGTELINSEPQYPARKGLWREPAGIKPNIWHAKTDNDNFLNGSLHYCADRAWHLVKNAQITVLEKQQVVIKVTGLLAAPACDPFISTEIIYKIGVCGCIKIDVKYDSLVKEPFLLPRLGVAFEMPREFDNVEWYGRDNESYPDMLLSSVVDSYHV